MENLQSSLPGWEIVRCIGSGSSGKVYELKKKDEYGGDFHCALKVISVPGSQKEYDEMLSTMSEFAMRAKLREKVEEISSEYRLLGALRGHPNVVNCEDQMIIPHENDMGWDIYIRMELLQSLPDYVRENGMTVESVIKLGSDMCSALELCRENNIIHRDIKPQNIFVSRYGVFKLGDFGVAKASAIRTSADKVGTYSYMAPEVYKGKGYDDRVDIYSLGMVLYWLLNERRGPFLPMPPQTPTAEQTTDAQIRRFRGETLPQPKNGGAALKKVVMTACSYKIADRYSGPSEFKRALKLAAQGKAEQAQPQPSFGSDEATVREDFKADPRPEYIPESPVEPRPQPQPKQKPRTEAAQAKKAPAKQAEPEIKPKKSMFGYILALFLIIAAMATAIIVFALSGNDGGKDDDPKESVRPTPTATPEPEKLDVKSVMLSSPSMTLTVEDEAQLKVSCMPEPAAGQDEPEYVWKSSDTSIVTVTQDGKLTAVSAGSATVMVYVKDKYYNNGSARRVTDPSEYTVECDMTGLGNREATVTYDGKTVTYTVRISLFG